LRWHNSVILRGSSWLLFFPSMKRAQYIPVSTKKRGWMMRPNTLYIASPREYDSHKERLKLLPCPNCKATGCLIRHGYLRGYGKDGTYKAHRGWRIFCSNRGRKTGCGKTYGILPALRLYRRIADAGQVWQFLRGVLDGSRIRAAWQAAASGFCRDNGYKIWAAFIRNQSHIRACLHRLARPFAINRIPSPATQLIFHLESAFIGSTCAVASFQLACQHAFLPL
jgi:hypothetical protein